jgi:hypothetical protein
MNGQTPVAITGIHLHAMSQTSFNLKLGEVFLNTSLTSQNPSSISYLVLSNANTFSWSCASERTPRAEQMPMEITNVYLLQVDTFLHPILGNKYNFNCLF